VDPTLRLVQPGIVNRRTGRVVGGHQRLKVLAAQGVTETHVTVLDAPEIEEKALNLALNSASISGRFTPDAVARMPRVERVCAPPGPTGAAVGRRLRRRLCLSEHGFDGESEGVRRQVRVGEGAQDR
jgi:hypothetical protein